MYYPETRSMESMALLDEAERLELRALAETRQAKAMLRQFNEQQTELQRAE